MSKTKTKNVLIAIRENHAGNLAGAAVSLRVIARRVTAAALRQPDKQKLKKDILEVVENIEIMKDSLEYTGD